MDALKGICRSAGRWVSGHFRLVAATALLAGLAVVLDAERAAIGRVGWSIDPLTLAGAVALFAVAPLAQALTLRIALRRLGANAPAVDALRVWARSFLLRYEPSGALGFVYRVRQRERLGATTAQVLTATGYEQIAAVTAGALVALGAFIGAGLHPPALAFLFAGGLGAAALALGSALVGHRLARWLSRRGVAVAGPLPGRALTLMIVLDAAGWAATAAGASLLAGGLLGPGRAPGALALVGAFALAWVVGVLVPLLPGGLGPRDAALAVALTPVIGPGAAAGLAVALRVSSFGGELLAAAGAEGAAWMLSRRRPSIPAAARPAHVEDDDRRAIIGPGARSIVVVPTYDERDALPLLVERFAAAAAGFELLVVDDNSPDGTGEVADRLAAQRPWMHVLHRAEKDGLGMAYRAGFRWCLDRGYELIGQMDSDLSHPPEKLPEMRGVLIGRGADLVLGSRYVPGGGTDGWSPTRQALSRIGCRASRAALGLPFSDLSGGFKLWRSGCLQAIHLEQMLSAGYAFQVETTQLAFLAGARIEEVPFVFSERVAGASKMTIGITLEGIRVTLALRRRRRDGLAGGASG